MQNPSPEHQRLVSTLIEHFREKLGYKIMNASIAGFPEPNKHGRHEPDIVAMDSNGVLQIAEAKATNEDLMSETAREQFIDFSNRVMADTNTPVPFHIVVYKANEPFLITRLNQLGLGSAIGNRIKIWTL
jgi:hypothetical protein